MNIIITGSQGLARSLGDQLSKDHRVTYLDRSNGHDINKVSTWAEKFYDQDMCINNAYHKWDQVAVLETFYHMWGNDSSKYIINIGSTISDYTRNEKDQDHEYMPYRLHKQALQAAFSKMVKQAKCTIKLINPGPMDTQMLANVSWSNKMNTNLVAQAIVPMLIDPLIKRIDLWQ